MSTRRVLTALGKQLVFVTNNSTKSRADYKKKFDKLGIPAEVVCIPPRFRYCLTDEQTG
jgi:ribonucleotide monophosphatase NagD (HAD superfamily)